ncbi:iron chaperone [Microlunatus sp. GCM10028923]|uniref:iron chaperone n=1 Tax=Microlunatus sp. GCM10028923 TaxID=3273400 RepID=UPI003619BA73
MVTFATVEDYLAALPEEVRPLLAEVRATILRALPDAAERISYGMPTATLDGRSVIHYAAWKTHLSVYPVPAGDADLEHELAPYRSGPGTLRFPLGRPIPYQLIGRVALLNAGR